MSTLTETEPLLHPSNTPHGINEDRTEPETESDRVIAPNRIWPVALFSLIACVGSVVVGMSVGYGDISEIYTLLRNTTHGDESESWTTSWFGAFGPLGALFGAPVAWPFLDKFGRKPALILSTIPGLMGWIALSVSNLLPTRGFLVVLFTGRFLSGFSAGWTVLCVSIYITEISTPDVRGLFGSCNQLFITVGIYLAYGLGFQNLLHYTYISLIAAGILVLFAVLLLFVKETPPWLYKKGKDLEGNRTLNFLRGPRADVAEEIRGIQSTLTDTGSVVDQLKAFRKRSVYLPLILILFLMFFQQVSVTNIYGLIFFDYSLSAFLTIGLLQIFATFVSLTLVDFLGRKTLLVISGSGMVVCSAALVILSNIWDIEENFMTSLGLLFIMSFSLGWGPIPWVMMSELVPLQVRGLASAAATFVNWLLAFSLAVIILNNDPVVSRFAWNIFSIVIMLCSIFFVLFLLPETKCCTLGEIEEHFKKGQVLYNPCKSMVQRSHRRQGCRGAVLCI